MIIDFAPDPHVDCVGDAVCKLWKRYNSVLRTFMNHLIGMSEMINEINNLVTLLVEKMDHLHYNHKHHLGHYSDDITGDVAQYNDSSICLPSIFLPIEGLLMEQYSGENITQIIPTKLFTVDYYFSSGPEALLDANYSEYSKFTDGTIWESFENYIVDKLYEAKHPRPKYNEIKPPKPGDNPKLNPMFPYTENPPTETPEFWGWDYEPGLIIPDDSYKDSTDELKNQLNDKSLIRKLMVEYITKVDQDGNELVYGVDFIIDPQCSYKPAILSRIENSESNDFKYNPNKLDNLPDGIYVPQSNLFGSNDCFELPENELIKSPYLYSWNDYLLTVGLGNNTDPVLLSFPNRTKGYILRDLIQESITLQDVDGDGFIYGKDFIIFGPNTPIELNSHYPLLCPSIMMTWDAYLTYSKYQFPAKNALFWVDLLINEFKTKTDLDSNGKVFGIDFAISDPSILVECGLVNDPSIPIKLFELYIDPDVPRIPWDSYLSDLGVFPQKTNQLYYDELSVKLSSEFNSIKNNKTKDYDGNELIYGLDILLIDYCSDKTGYLWTLEENERVGITRNVDVIKKLKRKFKLPKQMKETYTDLEYEEYYGELPLYPFNYSDCIGMLRTELMKYSNNDPIHNLSLVPNHLKFPKNILLITWFDLLKINGVI